MSNLAVSFASGESSLSVRRFSVHEDMSSLFAISIWARSPNDDIDISSIIGQPASFRATTGYAHAQAGERVWSGICSHMELVQAESTGLSTYYLRIVPTLWLLTQRRNNKIFQRKGVPDIVDEILAEWNIEPAWNIDRASYHKFEFRVQYGESDYAFVSRLLEEAGISFGFGDDSDKGSKLVFWDAPQHNEPRPGGPLRYVDKPNSSSEMEFVTHVRVSEEVRPGKVTVRDFDFRRNPSFKLIGDTPALGTFEDKLEQYVYSPSAFKVVQGKAEAAGAGSKAAGIFDDAKHNLIEKADAKVTALVNDEVTELLNKALKDVAGKFASDVAGDILGGISGEIAGNVAGKVVSDILHGDRESFDLHFEKILRDKVKGTINNRIAGKVDEKVTKFVTKSLGKFGKGKIGQMAANALGDAAKEATKALGTKVVDKVLGDGKQAIENGAGKAMKMLEQGQGVAGLLAGDDKGAARHDEKVGKELASRVAGSMRTGKKRLSFETNAMDLRPGTVISMSGHARSDIAPDTKLLVTSFALEGTQDGEWSMMGSAVFADQPYRPPMKTPAPKIEGIQSAIVVGPKGQEIHTDEHGRVRVQFHWDRHGQFDDESSLWMRVGQGWGGPGYGMMAIPRVGTEVMVSFLEGNPDCPVVMGQVFSTTSPVPHKLPDNKTVTAWRGNSSPGGGGFNEILFEDMKGQRNAFHAGREAFAETRQTRRNRNHATESTDDGWSESDQNGHVR